MPRLAVTDELPSKLHPGTIIESKDDDSKWHDTDDDTYTNTDTFPDPSLPPTPPCTTPKTTPPSPSIPSPTHPSPCHSIRLKALTSTLTTTSSTHKDRHIDTFLSKYSPYHDTHDLLPVHLDPDAPTTVEEALSAITDGSLTPDIDTGQTKGKNTWMYKSECCLHHAENMTCCYKKPKRVNRESENREWWPSACYMGGGKWRESTRATGGRCS